MKFTLATLACLTILVFSNPSSAQTQTVIPNPVLYLVGQEWFSKDGRNFIRYRYEVSNSDAYPDAMFAAAPTLPPCGTNTKASRTWVDLFDHHGKRLHGFCALGRSKNLNAIWFALEEDVLPPSWIYIELTDRQTGTKYKSNLAETTN